MPADHPLARHQAEAPSVIASGDADAIKRLYVDLARYWEESHGEDPEGIPPLSLAETHPVVIGLAGAMKGVVLDAGCGPNPILSTALAADPARTVVSLDMGVGTVRLARAAAAARGVKVLGVVGDLENLPFRRHAFDGVVCDDTIEHVPHDHRAVAELSRVVAARGPVIVATPNRHSLTVVRNKLRDRVRRQRRLPHEYFVSNSHLREYTWREVERLMRPAFEIRRRAGVGWGARGWKKRVATRAVTLGPLRRVSQMIVVEGTARRR